MTKKTNILITQGNSTELQNTHFMSRKCENEKYQKKREN